MAPELDFQGRSGHRRALRARRARVRPNEHRHAFRCADPAAQSQAAVARLVGLSRGEPVRLAAHPRIRRRPPRGGTDRRLAALQVHRPRSRRDALDRPCHHPRRDKDQARPGHLHAVVRRARQGHRRRHDRAARRRLIPLDERRSAPALVRPQRSRPGCRDRRRLGRAGRDRVAGTAFARRAEPGDGRRLFRPGLLPAPRDTHRRRGDRCQPNRLHRRPGLRAVAAGDAGGAGMGAADGSWSAVRHTSGRHAGARHDAPRGRPDPDRGRLHIGAPRAGAQPELLAVRDRPGSAGQLQEGSGFRRPSGPRGRDRIRRPATPAGRAGDRLPGDRVALRGSRTCRSRLPPRRGASSDRSTQTADRSAGRRAECGARRSSSTSRWRRSTLRPRRPELRSSWSGRSRASAAAPRPRSCRCPSSIRRASAPEPAPTADLVKPQAPAGSASRRSRTRRGSTP